MNRLGDLDPYLRSLLSDVVRQVIREELPILLEAAMAAKADASSEQPVYISVADASRRVSVRAETIRKWMKQRKLERYGSRRALRVRLDQLEQLMRTENTVARSNRSESAEQIAEALLKGRPGKPSNVNSPARDRTAMARRRASR